MEDRSPLAALRAVAGVTQEALSTTSGVARSTIALIESHRSVPSAAVAKRLAKAFSLTTSDIIDYLDGSKPLASIAPRIRWAGPASDSAPVVVVDDVASHREALDHFVMQLVHEHRPTLSALDRFRRWLSEIAPDSVVASELITTNRAGRVLAELLAFAGRWDESAPPITGPIALWRVCAKLATDPRGTSG